MNVQTIGASKRPKLSLSYGRTDKASPERAGTLPNNDLRRIVAAMIG